MRIFIEVTIMATPQDKIKKTIKKYKTREADKSINGGYILDVLNRNEFFGSTSKALLAQTCKTQYDFFKPKLDIECLLQHVVRGEQEEAEQIIAADPTLLYYRFNTTDYSGRNIIATPFQAALGAEDERMVQMMLPYFEQLEQENKIESACEEMLLQLDKQFPDDLDVQLAQDIKNAYDFNGIIAVIIGGENVDEVLEQFRLDMTKEKVIDSGKHFNMQHLLSAYKAYIENYDDLGNGNGHNRAVFWNNVIGYIQRQMPANYAQSYCTSIGANAFGSIEHSAANSFERILQFNNGLTNNESFFPLKEDSGLGFDFACYSAGLRHGGNGRPAVIPHVSSVERQAAGLEELCNEKTDFTLELRESLNSRMVSKQETDEQSSKEFSM
jgi:hypothetical protein